MTITPNLLDEGDLAKFKELRAEIAIGIDQVDRGLLAPLEPNKTLEHVLRRKNIPNPEASRRSFNQLE